jgi:ribosomal protein S18 acetylase RimI-like enzyme
MTVPSDLFIRPATPKDAGYLRRMLFDAWQWDPERVRPDYEVWLATNPDPESPYVNTFGGRHGDAGFVAERDGVAIGAAWYRLFDPETAQRGFVADGVPELAVAVEAPARGVGVGRRLMEALIEQARKERRPAISLHVNANNTRALRMYQSLGFVETRRDDVGLVMVLVLA